MTELDELAFLERAVTLAETNVLQGQRPFGALVVMDGRVVAEGANAVANSGDPTEHAEVQAIRAACRTLGTEDLSGAVVYTSCEPCVMCQATGIVTEVKRMVFAATSAQAAGMGFAASLRSTYMQGLWGKAAPGYVVQGAISPETSRLPFTAWTKHHGERSIT